MRRQRKAEALGADQAAKLDALDELWLPEPECPAKAGRHWRRRAGTAVSLGQQSPV
ncbi:hypothetical protein [Kitasatospora aureofaciens]|uniref:hypothetical protein n=1 Tax=Kitasatospora aureofaciens TaxID=1894 RepID=UPI0037CBB95D